MINTLLNNAMAQKGCIVFPPAGEADLQQAGHLLNELGFAALPPDFAAFLRLCDGLYYDGLEILGTLPHPRPSKQYTFACLADVNRPFAEYGYFAGKLIIGRMSENFIVYDQSNGLFAMIDRINLCSQIEFSGFNDLFASLLRLCEIEV